MAEVHCDTRSHSIPQEPGCSLIPNLEVHQATDHREAGPSGEAWVGELALTAVERGCTFH